MNLFKWCFQIPLSPGVTMLVTASSQGPPRPRNSLETPPTFLVAGRGILEIVLTLDIYCKNFHT